MNDAPRFSFFRLVARNLNNRPYQNLALVIAFALVAATLFSAQYLASGASESLARGTGWLGADLIVIPADSGAAGETSLLTGRPSMFFLNGTGTDAISRIPGVARASPQVLITPLAGQPCCSGYVQIIAIDPATDFSLNRWMDTEYGMPLERDGLIAGSAIEGDTGTELRFYGHQFHVSSRLVPTGMGGIDSSVFIRREDARVMADESEEKAVQPLVLPDGMVSWVLVQLEPGASPAGVSDAIRQQQPGTRVLTPASLSGTVTRNLAGIIIALHYAAVASAVITFIAFLGVSLLLARERSEEVTLLGALGATRFFVLRLVVAESFAASVIGTVAGIGMASLVLVASGNLIAFALGIPFAIPSAPYLLLAAISTSLLTVTFGGLLSIYPTLKVIRSEPYRAIRS
jgi:putative ABC transport system permease protein